MKTGIITSFVIGGILLLAILQFQTRVAKNSTEITLDITSKNQIETLRRIISHDFNRIGFGENSKIKNINPPHFINFSADVNGTGTSTVIWHFKENVQVKETENPNDRRLQRNGPIDSSGGSKPTKFAVVDFSITAYKDVRGEHETTNEDEVKSLSVEIVYESPVGMSSDSGTQYMRSTWSKHFVPSNLQFKTPTL